MKQNISFPATDCQNLIKVDDEHEFPTFYEKSWPQKLLLRKWHTKGNEAEAAEYAKLWSKRMKEAKEKYQEQSVKRCRSSSSESSQKYILKSHE